MKKIVFFTTLLFLSISGFSQNTEASNLKIELQEAEAEAKKIDDKIKGIQAKIDQLPGWKFGAFGTIGVNLSNFNNWHSNKKPNLSSGYINIFQNAYAKIMTKKYFWINHANLNLSWKKLYNKDKDPNNKGFEPKIDMFKLSSVFGYRLFEKFALAAVTDYRGSFIKNIYTPSFLDFGLGASWKPISSFYLVLTPLSYEFVFSNNKNDNYSSSSGAKLLADYTREIGNINLKTNLSAFISYKGGDYSSWTWMNSISYTLWENIGLGLNFGLRQNKQEEFNSRLTSYPSLKDTKNKMQSFWMFGLSYTL